MLIKYYNSAYKFNYADGMYWGLRMTPSKYIGLKINKIRLRFFPKDFELSEDDLIVKAKKKLHRTHQRANGDVARAQVLLLNSQLSQNQRFTHFIFHWKKIALYKEWIMKIHEKTKQISTWEQKWTHSESYNNFLKFRRKNKGKTQTISISMNNRSQKTYLGA